MSTGPQRYPGASTAYWYQNRFGGDLQEVNVVVLHTTEGTNLPSYDGGASAPNLTLVPDFKAKRLKAYQHFDFDRSSRALVNLRGGVETNTLNVTQVELVGTCDPATHAKWKKAGYAYIYWPEAPEWALQGVANLLAWAHQNHGVPLTGLKTWKAYPASYGSGNGVRMSFSAWESSRASAATNTFRRIVCTLTPRSSWATAHGSVREIWPRVIGSSDSMRRTSRSVPQQDVVSASHSRRSTGRRPRTVTGSPWRTVPL
ncbi:hypothetical protein KBY91_34245 [Streptomyces sp. RK23]|uniref:hypothetical protein n=1 Tax=unclassified Streptomyces TaxID=2593676 RepID=UPI001B366B83|nr:MULTISPECIES: hypothetical protein [unclassified Streptomyces]MBQ0968474.1 hypothetical protein [Streptomyces sp. RK74B]MBQ1008455.1 hypothetical protein [Streptomyces sp. RK23]